MSTMTQPADPTLTAADRCDRCGAQAYVHVLLEAGALLFCAHHWRQHGDAVKANAVAIIDETSVLSQAQASSQPAADAD